MNGMHQTGEQTRALELIESSVAHVFVTGRAGTGKTTLLDRLREGTTKSMVVLAPTGVAAVRARGMTIHSFFRIKPGLIDTASMMEDMRCGDQCPWMVTDGNWVEMIRALDRVVIDEISMVRADLLDMVDLTLRHHRRNPAPFGGVQMVFIGDLYQLAPVLTQHEAAAFNHMYATPYFHGARVMDRIRLNVKEFTTVFRQSDSEFIDLLDRVRTGTMTDEDVIWLNMRYRPPSTGNWDMHVHLFSRFDEVAVHNQERLDRLPVEAVRYEATVVGKIDETKMPADIVLDLKPGARVILLKNDWYRNLYNGQTGTVISSDADGVMVDFDRVGEIRIGRQEWMQIRYTWNRKEKRMEEEVLGVFTQIPLRLAWAMTIHKGQGLGFDRVAIRIDEAFSSGQLYVALSRCHSWRGLRLCQPIHERTNFVDPEVTAWLEGQGVVRKAELTADTCFRNAWLRYRCRDIRRALDWYMQGLERMDPNQNPVMKRFARRYVGHIDRDGWLANRLKGRLERNREIQLLQTV